MDKDQKPPPYTLPFAGEDKDTAGEQEIKEFHFHIYYFQDNPESRESAMALREKVLDLTADGYFHAVPLATHNDRPRGPHPVGSFEVWCPKEGFSRAFGFFLQNRGSHSVLVHPLTREEAKDHTERASWMGPPFPLDITQLSPLLDRLPAQYPELGLGYSKRDDDEDATIVS
ncbi:MAG: DOPA-like domain-containing protein [Piptocephalis tieghemiana]|nr:MAG: DOPA-like domain-containing protein [Piptocephalis tieghemiana]